MKTYLFDGCYGRIWLTILDVSKPSRLVAFFDRDTRAHYISKCLESFMKVLVGPLVSKALDENVAFSLH